MGQRISKTVTNKNTTDGTDKFVTTYYVRDLQGNVLAVYEHKHGDSDNGTFTLAEQHLYGASRLGMRKRDLALNATNANESTTPVTHYELTNHLGNVLAVISDEASDTNEPTVVSLSDYYPYGMEMPGRSYSESDDYRYGYTGHEKVEDLADGVYITEYRLLDTRLGRWMSLDPCAFRYPGLSPYNYGANIPTVMNDPNGDVIICTSGNHDYVLESLNKFISIAYSGDPIFSCNDQGVFLLNRYALYKFKNYIPYSTHDQMMYELLMPIVDYLVLCICDSRNVEFIYANKNANPTVYQYADMYGCGYSDTYSPRPFARHTLDPSLHNTGQSFIAGACDDSDEGVVELFVHEVAGHIGGIFAGYAEHTDENDLLAVAMSNNVRAIYGKLQSEEDVRGNDGNHQLGRNGVVSDILMQRPSEKELKENPELSGRISFYDVIGYGQIIKRDDAGNYVGGSRVGVPFNVPLPKGARPKNEDEFDMTCPYNTNEKFWKRKRKENKKKER
jgi:RHS repeat-associated protein